MADSDELSELLRSLLGVGGNTDNEKSGDNSENAENAAESGDNGGFNFGGIDIEMLLKLGELFEQMNKPSKNTELLLALKPHLRAENRAKVDSAIRMLQLLSIIPALKESGLLDKLF